MKANKSDQDVIEKYKKEILQEGLQIEEEGLENIRKTSYARDVLKISSKDYKKSDSRKSLENHDVGRDGERGGGNANNYKDFKVYLTANDERNDRFKTNPHNIDDFDSTFVAEHTFDEYENYTDDGEKEVAGGNCCGGSNQEVVISSSRPTPVILPSGLRSPMNGDFKKSEYLRTNFIMRSFCRPLPQK